MKQVLTAIVLSGSVGLGVQVAWSQDAPGSRQPGQTVPDKIEPKAEQSIGQSASMSTDDIRKLEQALQAKGHNPGPVDGIMDKQTQDALRAFQKANNLAVTGFVDKETASKLGVQLGGSTQRAPAESTPGSKGSTPGSREEGASGSKGSSPGSTGPTGGGSRPGGEEKSSVR